MENKPIRVSGKVLKALKMQKEKQKLRSMDAVLQKLLKKQKMRDY